MRAYKINRFYISLFCNTLTICEIFFKKIIILIS